MRPNLLRTRIGATPPLLLAAVMLAMLGCGSVSPRGEAAPASADPGTRAQGGVLADTRQARCERALARLGLADAGRLTIRVLDNPAPGAFAWPDGRLYVTRGLIDLANDDELAAAVAHEAGHLMSDRHLKPPFALSGAAPGDAELRADFYAAELLRRQGIPGGCLCRVLEKVMTHPSTEPEVRRHLASRVAALGQGR